MPTTPFMIWLAKKIHATLDYLRFCCMLDTFVRARTRPKGRQAKRATIWYLVYNLFCSTRLNIVCNILFFHTHSF